MKYMQITIQLDDYGQQAALAAANEFLCVIFHHAPRLPRICHEESAARSRRRNRRPISVGIIEPITMREQAALQGLRSRNRKLILIKVLRTHRWNQSYRKIPIRLALDKMHR